MGQASGVSTHPYRFSRSRRVLLNKSIGKNDRRHALFLKLYEVLLKILSKKSGKEWQPVAKRRGKPSWFINALARKDEGFRLADGDTRPISLRFHRAFTIMRGIMNRSQQ